jgi:hypothetical protein
MNGGKKSAEKNYSKKDLLQLLKQILWTLPYIPRLKK